MIKLLINDPLKKNIVDESGFGGLPITPIDRSFEWPKCKNCGSSLQYLGKIKTDIGLEMIFMCNDDPGMCDEWDAEGGGNKVLIVDNSNLKFVTADTREESVREVEHGVKELNVDANDYDAARENYTGEKRDVLGQLFGEPTWLQGDETPNCDCCSKPMRFVAQLEEGPDYKTAMNFGGGGVAYLFDCTEGKTGKFLWQC